VIPKEDSREIRAKGKFELEEIAEIEKRTNHDVIAFLENVASYVGRLRVGCTRADLIRCAGYDARGADVGGFRSF
jgi:adenylosuccinate lyase